MDVRKTELKVLEMPRRKRNTQEQVFVFHKLSRDIINALRTETESTSPMVLLTPIYNFTRKTGIDHGRFTNIRHLCQRWTLKKHIMSLFRINLVRCDKNKQSDDGSSAKEKDGKVSTGNVDIGTANRKYKLIHEEVEEYIQNETPMERLKRNFTKNHVTKKYTEDVEILKHSLQTVVLILSFYGFMSGTVTGKDGFLRRNRFTLYHDAKAMHGRLYNTAVLEGFKNAFRLNFKYLGFIVPAIGIEKCLSIYRNKSSPVHFAVGFGLSGGLYRFTLGPKGMFAGTIIAGFLGLVLGTGYYYTVHAFGYSQELMNRKAVYEVVAQQRSYRRPETNVPDTVNSEKDSDYDDHLD